MKRMLTASLLLAGAMPLAAPALALAQATEEAPPAGGAAIGQVIIATAGAMVLTAALLYFGLGHRSGKVPYLGRLANFSERMSGLPGWAALPSAIAAGALLLAFLGFLWDVSIHIDTGRDEGPLANPSHYLILGGLFGIFTAGFVACVLPLEKPSKSAVRIVGNWYAPLGGVVMATCGMFALIGFPLDDVWHRIFGQDVTLWGPTHLMLIGGAAMTLIGIAILMVEAGRAQTERGRRELLLDHVDPPRRSFRRPPHRPHGLPRRVRLRSPAVPDDLRPDAHHARGRCGAYRSTHVARARRGDRRRRLLPPGPRHRRR